MNKKKVLLAASVAGLLAVSAIALPGISLGEETAKAGSNGCAGKNGCKGKGSCAGKKHHKHVKKAKKKAAEAAATAEKKVS